MNILALENKFKALDEKEKQVRHFYNPKAMKGKRHHYIADIRADFHYDTLLYGLGQFWMQDSDSDSESVIADTKPDLESKKDVVLKGKIVLKIPKSQALDKLHPKSRSPLLAKRKNLGLLDLQNPLIKDDYEGIFSDTKVLNTDYLYKKPEYSFGKSGWKTAATGDRTVRNKAARVEIMYSSRVQDCREDLLKKIQKNRCESPQKLAKAAEKGITKEDFKIYLEEFKELVLTGKEPAKFQLNLESLRKEPAEKPKFQEPPKLFQIIFQPSHTISVKSSNKTLSLSLTDISSPGFPTQHYQNLITEDSVVMCNGSEVYDLSKIFAADISYHTIRVLIQGETECIDYYVSIQDYHSSLQEDVKMQIIEYKLAIYEMMKSQSKRNLVVPLNFQKIQQRTSPSIKKRTTLPQIETRPKLASVKKQNYANPLTSSLFSYKKNTESFHPQAYPANLTIFEAHDFIEENYSLPPRPKPPTQRPKLQLGVSGYGLNSSYLNV